MLTLDRLNCDYMTLDLNFPKAIIKIYVDGARNLNLIKDESIVLIATHPSYVNIIPYSKEKY